MGARQKPFAGLLDLNVQTRYDGQREKTFRRLR